MIERCICWRLFFGRFELTSRGGTNVWRGSSKSHLLVSRQIRRCLFREEGILNPLAKFYAASQMSEVQAWVRNTQNEAIWVDHMSAGEELFLKNLLGPNAVSFKGVDTFQQLHTSSVPWGERQHRGEIDRHCLAPFCWRKAHCCFQIRMIGHFFRNYIWLHSLHAFSGPMHVPHAGWITARQSRPYRIKESFHIVGCKVNSLRSMHWFAKIHCIDWQLLPCCCRWQLLPK